MGSCWSRKTGYRNVWPKGAGASAPVPIGPFFSYWKKCWVTGVTWCAVPVQAAITFDRLHRDNSSIDPHAGANRPLHLRFNDYCRLQIAIDRQTALIKV